MSRLYPGHKNVSMRKEVSQECTFWNLFCTYSLKIGQNSSMKCPIILRNRCHIYISLGEKHYICLVHNYSMNTKLCNCKFSTVFAFLPNTKNTSMQIFTFSSKNFSAKNTLPIRYAFGYFPLAWAQIFWHLTSIKIAKHRLNCFNTLDKFS